MARCGLISWSYGGFEQRTLLKNTYRVPGEASLPTAARHQAKAPRDG